MIYNNFSKKNYRDFYSGFLLDDCKNDQGEYVYVNGDVYNGKWNNDEKEGQGVFHYK